MQLDVASIRPKSRVLQAASSRIGRLHVGRRLCRLRVGFAEDLPLATEALQQIAV